MCLFTHSFHSFVLFCLQRLLWIYHWKKVVSLAPFLLDVCKQKIENGCGNPLKPKTFRKQNCWNYSIPNSNTHPHTQCGIHTKYWSNWLWWHIFNWIYISQSPAKTSCSFKQTKFNQLRGWCIDEWTLLIFNRTVKVIATPNTYKKIVYALYTSTTTMGTTVTVRGFDLIKRDSFVFSTEKPIQHSCHSFLSVG